MTDIPETRYVRSRDADLAYQVFGAGEDLVAIPGLPSHLEVMWSCRNSRPSSTASRVSAV